MTPLRGRRWSTTLGALLTSVAAAGGLVLWQVAGFDREAWVAEFGALKVHMARSYANLDWMVEHRGLDLAELSGRTESALRSARMRWQARRALDRFVAAFDDPHLRVEPLPAAPAAVSGPAPAAEPARDCEDLGYEVRDRGFIFPFSSAPGWRPLEGDLFPGGIWDEVGVLRIAHFGEDGYREICETVITPAEPRQIRLRVRERLMQEMRRSLEALRGGGARTLLVDVTGNGGGTEWVAEVVRLLAAGTLRRQEGRRIEARCDRTAIWEGSAVCPALGEASETTMEGEGAWPGPIALLVDGRSASATEDLIVWLKENGAARVLGERTMGAGCGYVSGGDPADLTSIGLRVLMPNCARFLSDGTNEIEGIEPDARVPIREGSPAQRLETLRRALAPSSS